MIYFIAEATDRGLIKIGYSGREATALSRMKNMQVGSPSPLRLLGLMEGGKGVETQLHERFAESRVHGEWFRPTDAIVEYIDGHTYIPEKPPERESGKYTRINVYLGKGAEGEMRKRYLDRVSGGNVSELIQRVADGEYGEEMDVDMLITDVRAAVYEVSPNADSGWLHSLEDELRKVWG